MNEPQTADEVATSLLTTVVEVLLSSLAFYGVTVLIAMAFGMIAWANNSSVEDRKWGARLVLFGWMWPVFVIRGARRMLRDMKEELE